MRLRRVLFTVVFTLFLLTFYALSQALFVRWSPEWAQAPADITTGYLVLLVLLFGGIVLLAFVGASSVVYGNLSGSEPGAPERPSRFRRQVLRPEAEGDERDSRS